MMRSHRYCDPQTSPSMMNTNLHPRNVYIASLPARFTEEHFRELFRPFGAIEGLRLVPATQPGLSDTYGFVMFVDPSSANEAIQTLGGQMIDGCRIQVRHAKAFPNRRSLTGGNRVRGPVLAVPQRPRCDDFPQATPILELSSPQNQSPCVNAAAANSSTRSFSLDDNTNVPHPSLKSRDNPVGSASSNDGAAWSDALSPLPQVQWTAGRSTDTPTTSRVGGFGAASVTRSFDPRNAPSHVVGMARVRGAPQQAADNNNNVVGDASIGTPLGMWGSGNQPQQQHSFGGECPTTTSEASRPQKRPQHPQHKQHQPYSLHSLISPSTPTDASAAVPLPANALSLSAHYSPFPLFSASVPVPRALARKQEHRPPCTSNAEEKMLPPHRVCLQQPAFTAAPTPSPCCLPEDEPQRRHV